MWQEALSETLTRQPRVACVGEMMVMFAPPQGQLIESCSTFESYLGGSEANVAIGLERLGIHSAWMGKLTANSLGNKLVNELRSQGVDTSGVVWTNSGRVGTFFFEWGPHPRRMRTIYDRAESSASTYAPPDVDWAVLSNAEWVHLTGITPALGPACLDTVREILAQGSMYRYKICFDVNYRELLWTREYAAKTIRNLLPSVNVLVGTEPDLRMLAEPGNRQEILAQLAERYTLDSAVMTLGPDGSLAFDGDVYHNAPGHAATIVNRLGAGDAFVAGLMYGLLGNGLQDGLRYGSAMAALKLTVPQNTPIINREDVEALLRGAEAGLLR